jgi:hypothetical protein
LCCAQAKWIDFFEEVEFNSLPVFLANNNFFSDFEVSPIALYPFRGKVIDSAVWVSNFPKDIRSYPYLHDPKYACFYFYIHEDLIGFIVRQHWYIEMKLFDPNQQTFVGELTICQKSEGESGRSLEESWIGDFNKDGGLEVLGYTSGEGWLSEDTIYTYTEYQQVTLTDFPRNQVDYFRTITLNDSAQIQHFRSKYPPPGSLFWHDDFPTGSWAIVLGGFGDRETAEAFEDSVSELFLWKDKYGLASGGIWVYETAGKFLVLIANYSNPIRAKIGLREVQKRGIEGSYIMQIKD